MTPEEVDLVRKSFDALWPVRRKLAGLFYRRFFELAPDSRRLFPDDMEKQHLKLMDSLAAIVGALDQREIFQAVISHTARQHAQFGAAPAHFVAFGEALIWGLQEQFGAAFYSGAEAGLGQVVRRGAEQDGGRATGPAARR
jgi:hemoglobin-like flavoprotein